MPNTTAEWIQLFVASTGFLSLITGLFLNYRRDTNARVRDAARDERQDLASDYDRVKGQRDECRQTVESLAQELSALRQAVEALTLDVQKHKADPPTRSDSAA